MRGYHRYLARVCRTDEHLPEVPEPQPGPPVPPGFPAQELASRTAEPEAPQEYLTAAHPAQRPPKPVSAGAGRTSRN